MSVQPDDRTGADHARLVEAMNPGVVAVNAAGRITAWNPRARQLLGYTRQEALGTPLGRFLHPAAEGDLPPGQDRRILRALRTGVPDHADGDPFIHRDGRPVTLSWSSAPIYVDDRAVAAEEPGTGTVAGAVIVLQDAAERHRIERERHDRMAQVRRANSRLELVAEITTVLSSTLDEGEVLRRLVRLIVPALGDWAEVDLLIPDGRIERAAATHRELSPADIAALEGPLPPLPRTPRGPLARVLHGGATLVVGGDAARPYADEPLTAAQDELFQIMDARSAIITPLAARGETYGALTLGYSRLGHSHGPDDRLVVEDIARRTGLLLANARVFAAQRDTAEAMQRSLLAPLPQPDDLQLQARYVPAARIGWVGGDWYDAFPLADGATGLVIGDIVGHDLHAASRMAQVRNMLRALAWAPDASPSAVLERLDAVMDAVSDAELATAVFARVQKTPGGHWRLHWCNAGHPPPLLITQDGGTTFLDERGMLLGNPDLTGRRPNGTCELPPRSTLLLYTDGLIETRGTDLGDSLTGLRRHSSRLARLPLPGMCDQLLDRMEPDGDDDVAVLALRVPG
ncbi:SpoIIE family protein phosphatase [Actinomadura sp. LD22]|uniref:SpoIIE family protein phosphatase n=1 Tax=Actinomadura physcomitrii TaxID=2650748 RepID=A0A6I4MEM9_9ACTN|nr:GAF domain-containing SpoIIE family protein phosphatase [Actinomadura physcomitrii]MWA02694.1 SpoIIE family protein phosphatase [Actinomadura physcomitrii]